MQVLLVKTSSMGDVIHTLPALTDAGEAIAGIRFDWVVEEGFAEIPAWHPAVDQVIPVAIRRWRKNLLSTWRSGEWRQFKSRLQAQNYDRVIDAQGLIKSAWLTRYADAPVYGLDRESAREPFAARFYDYPQAVAKGQHAVERTRQLFAAALGYPLPEKKGSYGIDGSSFARIPGDQQPVVIFLHGTTREDKHWPEPYWVELGNQLAALGYAILLPWGNDNELARAQRIAHTVSKATVLPRMNLNELAATLNQAAGVVAVDTGLGHLAAALDTPSVSLYGPTSPVLVGAYGENQVHLQASEYPDQQARVEPAVFAPLTPGIVLQAFQGVVEAGGPDR
jgi:heptosyltransferase-1